MTSLLHGILVGIFIPVLWGLSLSHKQSCQCVYLSGTQGKIWGKFVISATEIRYNKSECLHIFITGAEQEIIELRFDLIHLRKECVDQIHIYPHLHESVFQDPGEPEETICNENSEKFTSTDVATSFIHPRQQPVTKPPNITSNNIESFPVEMKFSFEPLPTRSHFRINHRPSIFSSGRVLAMRLIYKPFHKDKDAFKIMGRFQFMDKVMFKNDGNLVTTTYCDYKFLPHPINYNAADSYGNNDTDMSEWRHFYSPRYPAKYPDHIKCTYKFIGSCLHNSDKITVYDSKTGNMSSIIDVFCNERPSMKVMSSGPNLLIEFEASSNRTSNGFSAKYRFIDIFSKAQSTVTDQFYSINNGSFGLTSRFIPTAPTNRVTTDGGIYNSGNLKSLSKHLKQQVVNNTAAIDDSTKRTSSNNGQVKANETMWTNTSPTVVEMTLRDGTIVKDVKDSRQMTKTGNSAGSHDASQVRVCTPGSNCDKIIASKTVKNGTIQSPMFPGPYPARTLCRYEFQGQERERIQIKFFEFSLPSEGDSYDCEEADTLQVLLPIRDRYEPVETLCGDTMPKPIMSNGPKMLLEFRGRQSGKGNRGFKAEYRFLENFGIISGEQLTDVECAFKFNSSVEKSGWFHSPNFPGAYPRNIECSYLFYGDLYDRIFIRFTYFDVEGIFPCEESTASDYVEFSNFLSIDRKFRRFCGKRSGFSVRSDGRFFRITFRTNDRFDKTGFRASYSFEAEQSTTESSYTQEINKSCKMFGRLILGVFFCFHYP